MLWSQGLVEINSIILSLFIRYSLVCETKKEDWEEFLFSFFLTRSFYFPYLPMFFSLPLPLFLFLLSFILPSSMCCLSFSLALGFHHALPLPLFCSPFFSSLPLSRCTSPVHPSVSLWRRCLSHFSIFFFLSCSPFLFCSLFILPSPTIASHFLSFSPLFHSLCPPPIQHSLSPPSPSIPLSFHAIICFLLLSLSHASSVMPPFCLLPFPSFSFSSMFCFSPLCTTFLSWMI